MAPLTPGLALGLVPSLLWVLAEPIALRVDDVASARAELPEPEDQASLPGPRVGYFGVLDERLDLKLLARAGHEVHAEVRQPVQPGAGLIHLRRAVFRGHVRQRVPGPGGGRQHRAVVHGRGTAIVTATGIPARALTRVTASPGDLEAAVLHVLRGGLLHALQRGGEVRGALILTPEPSTPLMLAGSSTWLGGELLMRQGR